ncbi:SAM-dependent methyltransferase [Sphingomonas profundi]|uniref:SAM-dependent methyltransferase n=1 Tax=Alterirhizorhabdus profundi TaxID=2681549 RepID=UPI0012E71221|nr:SAM-dependent methyltransferase [Sphingomonas profundi]
MSPTPSPAEIFEPSPLVTFGRAASNDNATSDMSLDQFYTTGEVAETLYNFFDKYIDPLIYLMVEPSAGQGAFFRLFPAGSLGYDRDPRFPGVRTADFLNVSLDFGQPIAIVGNPPFGTNSALAVSFFNHAAKWASVIAFILPKTFRKIRTQERLDHAFHLLKEMDVPDNAFVLNGKPHNVPTVFQIWGRRRRPRPKLSFETRHPDFKFVKLAADADFAIRRIGARAGAVEENPLSIGSGS